MKLLMNLVRKDYKSNWVITLALAAFLLLSTLLMAGGLRVTGTVISSLNGLNEMAILPEYLQMHKGDFDEDAFVSFTERLAYIEDSQIVKMLNIDSANIIYQGETLEKYMMDNGFIVQNERFDFLLDLDHQIAVIKDGGIGVPVYYAEKLGIQVGDVIVLHKGDYRKELIVTTIIRDAAMNAALASSKRFLMSPNDLDEISRHMGEWEYCFEFLLAEGVSTADMERTYKEANMPANGVAITGSMLTMLNNLSHGLIALIIISISMFLIIVALLCLSYIIRATIAEENYAIGELKAIGMPNKAIARLYRTKYIMLVSGAAFVGYLAAIPFGDFLSSSVIMHCGYGDDQWMKWIFPLIGVILLSFIAILGCNRIIHRNLNRSRCAIAAWARN